MTVISIFSGLTSVLICHCIINIHLFYHGFQISLMRENWQHNYGPIYTTLEELLCHKKRDW